MYKLIRLLTICCSNKEEENSEAISNIVPQSKEVYNSPSPPEMPQNEESTVISDKNPENPVVASVQSGKTKKNKRNKQRRSANLKIEEVTGEVLKPAPIAVQPLKVLELKPLKGILKKPKKYF